MKILDLQLTTPVENPVSSVSMRKDQPFYVLLIRGKAGLFIRINGTFFDSTAQSSRAIEILKERYALGEIDEEEYNRKFKMLKS